MRLGRVKKGLAGSTRVIDDTIHIAYGETQYSSCGRRLKDSWYTVTSMPARSAEAESVNCPDCLAIHAAHRLSQDKGE